jgi:c-di-GMP-binding flagellar brake protein YcgR
MSFLDTVPAAIESVDHVGPWERFRVSDPRQCLAALRKACHGDAPVTLGAAGGPGVSASLWSVNEAARKVHFSVNGTTRDAAAVVSLSEVWAALYAGDVKLQFPLRGLSLGHLHGGLRSATSTARSLSAELPNHLYALHRRKAVRVRRASAGPPLMRLAHPSAPDQFMSLVVLDLSVTGCAVRKPAGLLPLLPGQDVCGVEIELDPQTFLVTDMMVQHVTLASNDPAGDAIVGCRWHDMPRSAQETLAAWIAGGRRHRDLMSIDFD